MKEVKITAQYDILEDQYIISSDDVKLYDTDNIVIALKAMSVYYTDLTYIGRIDGHHFIIDKVINEFNGKSLLEGDIEEMYYEAFSPECIVTPY